MLVLNGPPARRRYVAVVPPQIGTRRRRRPRGAPEAGLTSRDLHSSTSNPQKIPSFKDLLNYWYV